MGLALPTLAADGYGEVTISYSGFFGTSAVGTVTIDRAKAVTNAGGSVAYYEVPAQVQVTVTLFENSYDEYLVALRWFDAQLYPDGGTSSQKDAAFALVSPGGSLTEYSTRPSGADFQANQLTPGQAYTFTVEADRADVVILDCGYNNDLFLMSGIQLRCAGGDEETPAAPSFTDVAASSFCAQPVAWAVEKGITTGTTATTFSPETTCTRGQIVTFLYRDLAG